VPEQHICGVAGQVTRAATSTSLTARAKWVPPDFTQISDAADMVAAVNVAGRGAGDVVHDDLTQQERSRQSALAARQIRSVAAAHQCAVEFEYFTHQAVPLVAVVDDENRGADIHPDDVDVKVG
jgi:hypothetical protein